MKITFTRQPILHRINFFRFPLTGYSSFKRLTPITTTTTSVQVNEQPKSRSDIDHIAEVRIERHQIILQEKLQEGQFAFNINL